MQDEQVVKIRESYGPAEYPALVEVWRSAVRPTHDFLEESDFQLIESDLAQAYFPAVSSIVAERAGEPVGFAGIAEGNLEVLFVTDEARGEGIGTKLLNQAIAEFEVTRVDVNEQNSGACGFYLSQGFAQVGRDELDGDGRPYPTLHLELSK